MTGVLISDVTGDATVALAVLTAVLAIVAVVGAVFTRMTLRSAQLDSVEATKSRIDQQAPRFTVIALASAAAARWGPNQSINGLEHQQPVSANDPDIGITGWFRVINEGRSSLVFEVPIGVLVLQANVSPSSLVNLASYAFPQTPNRVTLGPDEVKVLFVWTPRPVAEWADELRLPAERRTPLRVEIKAEDARRHRYDSRPT